MSKRKGTEQERRDDALQFIGKLLADGVKIETLDASAQLALIDARERGPEHVEWAEYLIDAIDEWVITCTS